MAPHLVEAFVIEATSEFNRLAASKTHGRDSAIQRLAKIEDQLAGLVDAIADGLRGPSLQTKLDALEQQKSDLEQKLQAPPAPPIRLHPNLAGLYRERTERLTDLLTDPDYGAEARDLVRSLIERVQVSGATGDQTIELVGDIVAMIGVAQSDPGAKTPKRPVQDEAFYRSAKVVAGVGFEPTTFRL